MPKHALCGLLEGVTHAKGETMPSGTDGNQVSTRRRMSAELYRLRKLRKPVVMTWKQEAGKRALHVKCLSARCVWCGNAFMGQPPFRLLV